MPEFDVSDPFAGPPGPDLDEQFSFNFSPEAELTPGFYPGVCVGIQRQMSKAGNPMYVWDMRVTGGPYTGDQFFNYTALTEAAQWKLMETADAFELPHPDGVLEFTPRDVIDKPVALELVLDSFKGRNKLALGSVRHPSVLAEGVTAPNPEGLPVA